MESYERDAYRKRLKENLAPKVILRSTQGMWKHNIPIYWFAERRAASRRFGKALARVDRTIVEVLTRFFMGVLQTDTRGMWDYDIVNMLTKFAPDMGEMLRRERYKLNQNEWDVVPWAGMVWWDTSPYKYLHGVHMSKETPGNIAYAESQTKREAGRYTSTKAGRYLTRFFGDKLDEKQIKMWAEKCAASVVPLTLEFIGSNDPTGWMEVYHDGPDSCMSGESSECVAVYAHDKSVLRLAYVTRGNDTVGRCIVREDTTPKQYIRVYPNTDSTENQKVSTGLTSLLQDAGYVPGNLHGVLLKATRTGSYDDNYMMPYLDYGNTSRGCMCVTLTDDEQYFRVTRDGIDAQSTSGYINVIPQVTCEDCDDSMNEDETNHVEYNDRTVCESCLCNNYVHAYGRRGNQMWASNEDCVENESDGEQYIEQYANENDVYQCDVSGNWYHSRDMVSTSRGMVCTDDAIALDKEDPDGNDYAARKRDTVETHDGRTIHRDSAEDRDGKQCHVDDEQDETETQGEEA